MEVIKTRPKSFNPNIKLVSPGIRVPIDVILFIKYLSGRLVKGKLLSMSQALTLALIDYYEQNKERFYDAPDISKLKEVLE